MQLLDCIIVAEALDERHRLRDALDEAAGAVRITEAASVTEGLMAHDRIASAGASCLVVAEQAWRNAPANARRRLDSLRSILAPIIVLEEFSEENLELASTASLELLEAHDLDPLRFERAIQRALKFCALERVSERQRREIERFGHVLAHELGQPIGAILRLLDMRTHTAAKGETSSTAIVDRVRDKAVQINSHLNSLKLHASLMGAAETTAQPLHIAARIAANRIEEDLRENGLAQRGAIDIKPLPTVVHNETKMAEVFRQIIKNALLYNANSEPLIVIHHARQSNCALVFIDDNGIGVDPVYAQQIFEPMERLHGPQVYPGSGLGLTMCRAVIEEIGGRIWIEPSELGGSRVCIAAPLAAEEEDAA